MPEEEKPIIYIVDDDLSVRRAMKRLFSSIGIDAQTFASGQEFLESGYRDQNACLIVDVKMPVMSGLELQKKLISTGTKMPVVFITAFDTEEIRGRAKSAGAAGYFRKPVDDQALLDSIRWALSNNPLEGI